MNPRQLTSRLSISPQLGVADIGAAPALRSAPSSSAVPTVREAGQPSIAEMRGLSFATIPAVPGKVTDEDAAQFGAALETLEGPVIAYCRTGVRAATLWVLSETTALGADAALNTTAAAGYDPSQLRPSLEQRYERTSRLPRPNPTARTPTRRENDARLRQT